MLNIILEYLDVLSTKRVWARRRNLWQHKREKSDGIRSQGGKKKLNQEDRDCPSERLPQFKPPVPECNNRSFLTIYRPWEVLLKSNTNQQLIQPSHWQRYLTILSFISLIIHWRCPAIFHLYFTVWKLLIYVRYSFPTKICIISLLICKGSLFIKVINPLLWMLQKLFSCVLLP